MANAMSAVAGRSTPEYSIWRVIMASSVGTMIEWYDFYIFGSLAAILGPKFYPPGNDTFAYIAYIESPTQYRRTIALYQMRTKRKGQAK